MTGRIEELATPQRPGRIATRTGTNRFHFSYRLTEEIPEALAMGQLVSFELQKGSPELAVDVRPTASEEAIVENNGAPYEIRYRGFEQTGNVRLFKFQAWRSGEENKEAIVSADLTLFRKHQIGIQEGPVICLRLLKTAFQESDVITLTVWEGALSDEDLRAHVAIQASPKNSKRKRS